LKKYEHIFFDLDHTLWDFERSSAETIQELYYDLKISEYIPSQERVYNSFKKINRLLWDAYHLDKITKEELRKRRFEMVLEENGVYNETLAERFSDLYLEICPTKPHLLPNTLEALDYLAGKYTLHVLSNGFEETTLLKIKSSFVEKYFRTVCTPCQSGYKKPHLAMFQYAMDLGKCTSENAIMIGDDLEADIIGAKRSGLDQVYFNPEAIAHSYQITYEIRKIEEVKTFL